MLGFPAARSVGTVSFSAQGVGTIWLSRVDCSGNETNLANCTFPGWGINNCSHAQDVTVKCHSKSLTGTNDTPLAIAVKSIIGPCLLHAGEAYGAQVRLIGGQTPEQGYFQMLIGNTWGILCGTWKQELSDQYCTALGFSGNATHKYRNFREYINKNNDLSVV